jgi:hypothetical protein
VLARARRLQAGGGGRLWFRRLSPVACCLSPASCFLVIAAAACGAAESPATKLERRCLAGDATVQIDDEAAALAPCRAIAGGLSVGPSFALRSLAPLAGIERVAGELDVSDNVELTGIYLPALTRVEGDLIIENNRQVATVSLHRLVEVKGDLTVRDNRELLRLDLGALRRVGGRLEVSGHPQLDTVVLDRLERAGELAVEDNPAWPADEVDRVRRRLAPR